MSQKQAISVSDSYSLNEDMRVYFPKSGSSNFTYSDGSLAEDNLLEIIRSCSDRSVGSSELTSHIHDWVTRYHLSPQRADLLRPLNSFLKGDILEIGSGCGAITRYLGETGANIVAVEGSARRASVTAARCQDLENVKVYCDNFMEFDINEKFDVITLIGVLEYSQIYIEAENPIQLVLQKANTSLKPNGILIVAIENQLGLKYLAGAPEDHLGKKYVGIENGYDKTSPITFGKKVLESHINAAGFKQIDFLFPFPDYKFPSAVVTEKGCLDKNINLPDILKSKIKYFQDKTYTSSFDEEKAFVPVVQNELIEALSNSFLLIAGTGEKKYTNQPELVYTFSNHRRKEYSKQNKFVKKGKEYLVLKEKTYPDIIAESDSIEQFLANEKYIHGQLFINHLQALVEKDNWSGKDIFSWAKPWMDFLAAKSYKKDGKKDAFLKGEYFDATPFNLIVKENDNTLEFFDLEWKTTENLRLDYVIFRSLYYSFTSIPQFSRSVHVTYDSVFELVLEIMSLYFTKETGIELEYYNRMERQYQTEILGRVPLHVFEKKMIYNSDIDLTETVSLPQNIMEPVYGTKIQVFWSKEDMTFSEENSQSRHLEQQTSDQQFSFRIPVSGGEMNHLRLDLGNRIGFLNIHAITVKTDEGNVIWDWERDEIKIKNEIVFIEDGPGKKIQLSFNEDPWFIIELQASKLSSGTTELIVELNLSSLQEEQIHRLSRRNETRLLFTSKEENKETQESALALSKMLKELEKEKALSDEANGQKDAVIAGLVNDKNALFQELTSKTEVIQAIFSEKEQLLKNNEVLIKGMTNLENGYNQLDKVKIQVEKDLIHEQEKYAAILKEKQRADDKNTQLENSNHELIGIKTLLERNLTHTREKYEEISKRTEMQLKQLDQDKSILVSELNFKNQIIDNVSNEKIVLEKKVQEVTTEIKALEKEIAEKKNDLLKNEYEKHLLSERTEVLKSEMQQLHEKNTAVEKGWNKNYNDLLKVKEHGDDEIATLYHANNIMKATIEKQSMTIKNYQEKYEGKNIFQIIKNILIKKK